MPKELGACDSTRTASGGSESAAARRSARRISCLAGDWRGSTERAEIVSVPLASTPDLNAAATRATDCTLGVGSGISMTSAKFSV